MPQLPTSASHGVYLVTGGYGGIGSALSRILHASGKKVVLVGRSREKLESYSTQLDVPLCQVDLQDFEKVESAFKGIEQDIGPIIGVAHCVGSILLKPAHLVRQEEYQQTIDTNLTTAFAVLRASAKCMLENKTSGSLCFFSSAAARIGLTNHEAIAAAKGALEGLVRSAAATYASQGIRINAIAPGLTETPLTERITGNQHARQASLAMHPLGRLGAAEEVARAASWLLDPNQGWITGQILGVDGGLSSLKVQARK